MRSLDSEVSGAGAVVGVGGPKSGKVWWCTNIVAGILVQPPRLS